MNNILFEHLEWDSEFFKLKTGKVSGVISDYSAAVALFNNIKTKGYDLVYVYCQPDDKYLNRLVKKMGGMLYDEKTVFSKSVNNSHIIEDETRIYNFKSKPIPVELYKLSIDSGVYSRFNLDKKFNSGAFIKLYYKWIENSVFNSYADYVFVYMDNEIIKGFVTLKVHEDEGSIGLIAVDENSRGKSIGSSLVIKCEETLAKKNIRKLSVVTQKANIQAVQFYKKNNFEITSVTNIYHLWLK